jgi:glycosyltransferase involved in cell wall biosynthesis
MNTKNPAHRSRVVLSVPFVNQIVQNGRKLRDGAAELIDVLSIRLARHDISDTLGPRRLTLVHHGDYAEAYWRFANGGPETYYAQKYAVEFVESLVTSKAVESVTSVSLSADLDAVVLPNGVHTAGVEIYPRKQRPRYRQLVEAVRLTNPTHLIVMSPISQLITWGIRTQIPVLPMLADSFRDRRLRTKLKYRVLGFLLNSPSIEIVANHNLAASLDLRRIGVDPRKIVPFDWPPLMSARSYAVKNAPPANRAFRLLYVGSLIESKGVGDAIQALSKLRKRGRNIELTLIGKGDLEWFQNLATTECVQGHISFLGPRSHDEVLSAMRDCDAVLVPSRWSYPEGLPMTLYEALSTRTPLITSDHPMFALKIHNLYNALVFPEGNIDAFAECIEKLASSPELYAKLSHEAENAAAEYLCPLKYHQLISAFLDPAERDKLRRYSLATFDYGHSSGF